MDKKTYRRIKRNVMRRIYTAYAARIVSSYEMLYVAMFAVALAVFAHMVHVVRVLDNMFNQSFSEIPSFVLHALMRGEVLTLAAIGVMVFTALSIQWRVRHNFVTRMQIA